jgi:two-component system, LuxR family, sensor kinase FixL
VGGLTVRESSDQIGIQHVDDVRLISRDLVEKALRMRADSYLAKIKTQMLTLTLLEIDKGKKQVIEDHHVLAREHKEINEQKQKLELIIQEKTADLRREIEERKKYQKALQQAHDQLEARVLDRTQQLRASNQKLEKEVSEREQAEKQIRKLSHAIEQSLSAIVITNFDGKIEYINPIFTEITGYSSEEIIGKSPSVLKSGFHDKAFYKELWSTIKAGDNWKSEVCNRKKNGQLYWELQTITPIRDEQGVITNFISVRTDDTERKRAEEQLQIYAKELERSNSELESFASIASHDLMEPLRKIASFGERVMELVPTIEEKPKDYIRRMQRAAEKMNQLVLDLLNLSKVQNKPVPFEKIDLNEVVGEALENLEKLIKETKGEVHFDKLPIVYGESSQIMQLFQNLICNGLKFYSSQRLPKVYVRVHKIKNDGFKITVEDNGIGLDEKYCDRIFNPFERLHGHTEYDGTGMGLAICKKIVELHGGLIKAESVLGKGTKIIFTLPDKQKE